MMYFSRFALAVLMLSVLFSVSALSDASNVIDQDGVVQAAFTDVDYRKRMEPAAILAASKGLGAR